MVKGVTAWSAASGDAPVRQASVRAHNLSLVLRLVGASRQPLSRAAVAAQTGLTRATVSALVDDLLAGHLLSEVEPAPRTGAGRPAAGLVLAGDGPAGLGLEINVDYLAACVVDLAGAVRHRVVHHADQRAADPQRALNAVGRLAASVREAAERDRLMLAGAALAVPGRGRPAAYRRQRGQPRRAGRAARQPTRLGQLPLRLRRDRHRRRHRPRRSVVSGRSRVERRARPRRRPPRRPALPVRRAGLSGAVRRPGDDPAGRQVGRRHRAVAGRASGHGRFCRAGRASQRRRRPRRSRRGRGQPARRRHGAAGRRVRPARALACPRDYRRDRPARADRGMVTGNCVRGDVGRRRRRRRCGRRRRQAGARQPRAVARNQPPFLTGRTLSTTLTATARGQALQIWGNDVMTADPIHPHPAWLPPDAFRPLGSRRTMVRGSGTLVETVRHEVREACVQHGGRLLDNAAEGRVDLTLALTTGGDGTLGAEGYSLARRDGVTVVRADEPAGLLYGLFHVVRLGESAFGVDRPAEAHRPALERRMLDHWDNVDVHPVMGQVERGYSGSSIFWRDGGLREDLSRVRAYARLLAACGVNAVAVNNVNVHATEARLLTERLGDVAAIAGLLRPYGIRVHLSVSFAAPVTVGGLPTADPLDEAVRTWWAATTRRVYETIPDFGGYVVKADSEGQPGPFTYGRSHVDGANLLAEALAPHGGVVRWRAFVYNHRQDWRDRSTDRARAAFDHFAPLDGQFRDNAILQVKYGPMDFQTREPVSPVIAAMPATRLAVELQVTQEYTGQQRHVCYLGPMWSEVLGFGLWGPDGPSVADVAADAATGGGLVAVSNVGDDRFWAGHPLAQANLYAFGRLAWAPRLDPRTVLDEWIDLTFAPSATADPERLRRTLHALMDGSWRTYEWYTAPLGVGFMVRPGHHYGPDVDGYEYTPCGTYHFADRDGVGVDRTRASGTGFTGQYPQPWADVYESLERCPDELLLFFHNVPYGHVLHDGSTVIQHIYDTHFAGAEEVARMLPVRDRLDEQLRCAEEWRDQVNTYFFRKSGVPDALGRHIY